ncbi:MAG: Dabb family protein [Eubacteriales bacterium]
MIRHIVMFKFKEEVEGMKKTEIIEKAKIMIEELEKKIESIRFLKVGINSKEANQDNFDLVLVSDFDTMEDLNNYQVHPDHQIVVAFIKKVVESRACVDFEIQ